MRKISLLGIPMYTLAGYSGMGAGAAALKRAGALSALGSNAWDAGEVDCPEIAADQGASNLRNFGSFGEATALTYDRLKSMEGPVVVALGGECSLIVGEVAGFRRVAKGKPGMLWMDTHGDFNTPETTLSGYIGGMCLAFACGRGPRISKEVDPLMPLIDESGLVHFGSRDLDPLELAAMKASPMEFLPMAEVRRLGFDRSLARAVKFLEDRADWIVLHIDLDVADPSLIPAVNYPTAGGMTLDELGSAIRGVIGTDRLALLNIAAYNAHRDPDGVSAARIVKVLSKAFSK